MKATKTHKNHPPWIHALQPRSWTGEGLVGPKQSSHRSSVALLHARTREGAWNFRCNSKEFLKDDEKMKNLRHCWNFVVVRMMFLYHPPISVISFVCIDLVSNVYFLIPTTYLGDSQPIWWAFQKQSFCQGLHIPVHFETPVWINQLELWYIAEIKHVPHGEMHQLDPIGRLYLDSLLVHQKLFVVLSLNHSIQFGIFRSGFCTVAEVCGGCGWMGFRWIRSIPPCRWF